MSSLTSYSLPQIVQKNPVHTTTGHQKQPDPVTTKPTQEPELKDENICKGVKVTQKQYICQSFPSDNNNLNIQVMSECNARCLKMTNATFWCTGSAMVRLRTSIDILKSG